MLQARVYNSAQDRNMPIIAYAISSTSLFLRWQNPLCLGEVSAFLLETLGRCQSG
jgi:hypothetical protein